MTSDLAPYSPNNILLHGVVNKDRRAQTLVYVRWLDEHGRGWWNTDLSEYREYLLNEYVTRSGSRLSLTSASKYVEAVRRRYHALATDNALLDQLYAAVPADLSPADREAHISRLLRYVHNNAQAEHNRVKLPTIRHQTDKEMYRLSFAEALALCQAVGQATPLQRRNRAIVGFLFATGLRVAELCALVVDDLLQTRQQRPGVLVQHGKGNVQRFVYYVPELQPLMDATAEYFSRITSGHVFRPFESRHQRRLQERPIDERTVQDLFASFGLHPHQARHSYARMLTEEFGYSKAFAQEQLGHQSIRNTEIYIGKLDDTRVNELERHA